MEKRKIDLNTIKIAKNHALFDDYIKDILELFICQVSFSFYGSVRNSQGTMDHASRGRRRPRPRRPRPNNITRSGCPRPQTTQKYPKRVIVPILCVVPVVRGRELSRPLEACHGPIRFQTFSWQKNPFSIMLPMVLSFTINVPT